MPNNTGSSGGNTGGTGALSSTSTLAPFRPFDFTSMFGPESSTAPDAPQFGDGNCLVDNKTTPFTLSDQLSCPPHFYCPNINPRDAISFPSMCPPTLECQTSRLSAYFCQPQGKYEPIPCTRGFFCPDYTTILLCPQGHFCPTGSIAPRPCLEPGSYCPEGAPKQVFYGGVIVCLIIDAILLLGYACLRLAHWRNVRKRSREESRKMRGRQLGIAETTHSKKQAKFVTLCTDVDEEDDSLSSAPVRKSGIFSRRFWLKRLENAVNKLAIYFPIRFEVPQVPPPPVIAGMLSKPFKNLQQHHQEQLHRPATFMTSLQEHGQTVNRDHATMTVVSSLDNDHGMRTRTNGGMLRSINSIGSFLFPAPPATLPPPPPSSDTDSDMEGATTNALTPQPPRITVTVHGGEDETAQRVAQNVALDMRAAQSQTPTSMTTANGKNNNNNNPHHHYSLFFHEVLNGFHRAQDNRDLSLRFEFEKLSLTLPSGKTILSGVTGKISPGRVTVIMGPSGAGKSTFMNVLMGKSDRTGGRLMINGREAEMHHYKKIVGCVPQDDIMLQELTVRENIEYSARVRLPRSWTHKEIVRFADAVLDTLDLAHVAENLITSVSGGQRKRVNIGMELVTCPSAIFLDEPTSGLDATAALKVANTMKKIASDIGISVVSVIHQPRYEIFDLFDDVLMIAPGGFTAYLGPRCNVVAYFEDLGFFFDPRNNPADVLMDILSGRGVKLRDPRGVTVEMVRQDMVQLEEYDVMDLVRHWNTKEVGDLKAAKMAAAAAMVTTSAATSAPGSTVAISVRSTVLMEETFSATPAAASPPSASSHQMVREFDDEHSAYGTPETYACDMSIRSRANTIHRYRATSYLTCQSIEMSKSGEFRRASLEDSPHHFTGPILEGHEEDMADDLPTKLMYLNSPIVDDSCSAACDPPPTQAEVTATHRRLRKACMDRGANFFMQFLYAHNRSILQQYRKINALLMEIMVATISGALMGLAIKGYDGRLYQGLVIYPFTLISPSPIELVVPILSLIIGCAIGLSGAPAAVKIFSEERDIYYREAAAGHNKLAYYMAKNISSSYRFIISSLHFASFFMALGTPSIDFRKMYLVQFLAFFCVYGISYCVAMVVKRENAAMIAVCFTIISAALCGGGPNIKDMNSWGLGWMLDMSYARWFAESWYTEELMMYEGVFEIHNISAPIFGYTLGRFYTDVLMLALIGIAWRVLGFLLLVVVNKQKQR